MENFKVTASIAMQLETGLTPKGRPAHRTTYFRDVRPDLTEDEVMHLVDSLRPLLAFPVTRVRFVVKSVNTVWSEKKESSETDTAKTAARARKQALPEKATHAAVSNKPGEEASAGTIFGERADDAEVVEEVAAPAELMQMLAAHGLLVADAPAAEQQPVEAAVLPREKQILPKEILPQTLFETAAASVQDLPSGFSVEVDEEGFLRLSFKSEGPLTDEQVEIVNQKMGELSARMEELAGQTSFLAKEQKAKSRAAAPQTPKLSRAERRQLEREERKKQKQEEKRHPAA